MNNIHQQQNDHWKRDEHGAAYAGDHMLIELWGASNLCDAAHIGKTLVRAAEAAKATVLHQHFHHFGPGQGVSGVLVLAESHISIHTWPERCYAAIDVFMCGECDPNNCIEDLRLGFAPTDMQIELIKRGQPAPAEKVA